MPRNYPSIVNQRFGMFTVLSVFEQTGSHKNLRLLCVCDCGTVRDISRPNLRLAKSCGCHRVRHGHARRITRSREYSTWGSMIARCHNSKDERYPDYGGRGIFVCQRWREKFENFLKDMGIKPKGLTIERIDNSKGYEPANCKWATYKEQMANQRPRRKHES